MERTVFVWAENCTRAGQVAVRTSCAVARREARKSSDCLEIPVSRKYLRALRAGKNMFLFRVAGNVCEYLGRENWLADL